MIDPGVSLGLAGDARSLDALRAGAARDPKSAIKAAARQFEALFMQELMKSMRQATLSSGLLDNETTKLGTEMLDAQFATQMTGLPGGLAEAIARQLERQMGAQAPAAGQTLPTDASASTPGVPQARRASAAAFVERAGAAAFVDQHRQAAQAASRASGIPAAFMIGQAAHETGWGRREILNADGSPSHNLFGIKAGPGWSGPVAEVTTTEYVHGRAHKTVARFRAYGSYDEAFRDYAQLIGQSPRYSEVVEVVEAAGSASTFAQSLQRAGYATDPAYAEKLTRVINTALRLQQAQS